MRYALLVLLICLGIAFDLGVYVATSDDTLGSFDPLRPATLLPIVANRLDALKSKCVLAVQAFLDEFAAPYRERLRHEGFTEPLPR
jgi:hypothetical protein